MSELKKAKYLGGIGAILVALSTASFLIFEPAFFISYRKKLLALIAPIFGFALLLLAVQRITNVVGEKKLCQNLILALGIGILSLFILIFTAPSLDFKLASLAASIPFLMAAIFLAQTFKELGKITKGKYFSWTGSLFLVSGVWLVFESLVKLFIYVYSIISPVISSPFLVMISFCHFNLISFLLWTFGFLLLAIAFFTLPENLLQKSSTEKKEV